MNNYEQIRKQRDQALEHFEYCLEHYGELDEDTVQAENDYVSLDSQLINYTKQETVQ